jgi:hypothetical protein
VAKGARRRFWLEILTFLQPNVAFAAAETEGEAWELRVIRGRRIAKPPPMCEEPAGVAGVAGGRANGRLI